MKKSLVLIISIITFLSFSCVNVNSKKMTIDTKKDKNLYEKKISVFPMENVEISNDVIKIFPQKENTFNLTDEEREKLDSNTVK